MALGLLLGVVEAEMKCRNHPHRLAEYLLVAPDPQDDLPCCFQCFQEERDFTFARGFDLPRFAYLSFRAQVKDWRAFLRRVRDLWRQLNRQYT